MTTQATIADQLAQLPNLPMKNLWAMWDEFFDQRPGHHHRTYLENRLAYKLQERAFGSISSTLRRRLEKIGETGEVPNQKRRSELQLAPGAVMVRDYNGITYRVTVLSDGRFELDGRLCFIATVSLQIVTSGFRPYHMSTPLIKQDREFVTGNLGVVKVDAGTHKFLTDINAAAKDCNIASGTPFLGLYNIPGVALALQATPVLSPWLNNVAQAEFVLERTHPEELRSVVLALNTGNTEDLPPLPLQLKAFPSGYRYCGMATYPFGSQKIQIWQNRGG